MDETEFRIFMTVLAYGCEWESAPTAESIERSLGLNEESFFGQLYEPVPNAEQELHRALEAGNRLICLHGRPGAGKSTVLRKVLREMRDRGHPILVIDFLRDFPKHVAGERREPASLVEEVGRLLKEKARAAFHGHEPKYRNLLRFYLERSEDREHDVPVERRFVPSEAMASAVAQIRLEQEIKLDERPADLLRWALDEARSGNERMRQAIHDGVEHADARDILYALRLGYLPDRKAIVVFDNMDSVPYSDDVIAARNWIRAQVGPFLDSATFVYAIRPETLGMFPHPMAEGAAIRTTRIDFDQPAEHPQRGGLQHSHQIGTAAADQRRAFEHQVVGRRLDFLRRWYISRSTTIPQAAAELFAAFWAARLVPRVREDADALANCNYRALVNSLGNFARVLCEHVKFQWTSFDSEKESELPERLAIHLESLYYAWLAGSHTPGAKPQFAIAEYNPIEWHRLHVTCERDGGPSLLGQKAGHIALATVYNLARQDTSRRLNPASTREVAERLMKLGFSPSEIRSMLMGLFLGSPAPTYASSRAVEEANEDPQASPWLRPSTGGGPVLRHLLQAVMLEDALVDIGESVRLPQQVELTDRGRQIIEYVAVKLHFLVGMFEAAGAAVERAPRRPVDLDSSPIGPEAYERFNRRLRRMAGFHLRCVEDGVRRLRPEFGDEAFNVLRRWYCLPGETGSRYPGENNLFMDRCLLSIEKYLDRLNSARFRDDASTRYLTEVRLLRRQFGDQVEQVIVSGRPASEAPAWLTDFDRYVATQRGRG